MIERLPEVPSLVREEINNVMAEMDSLAGMLVEEPVVHCWSGSTSSEPLITRTYCGGDPDSERVRKWTILSLNKFLVVDAKWCPSCAAMLERVLQRNIIDLQKRTSAYWEKLGEFKRAKEAQSEMEG